MFGHTCSGGANGAAYDARAHSDSSTHVDADAFTDTHAGPTRAADNRMAHDRVTAQPRAYHGGSHTARGVIRERDDHRDGHGS